MKYSLKLLGGARLDGEAGVVEGRAAHRRRLAVLTLLAASPGHSMCREKIVEYLWPDGDSRAGRHTLAEALYVLRRELGADAILGAGEEVALNLEVVSCDVAEFRAALEAGERERAAGLYAGPFLDGWFVDEAPGFDHWAALERDRLAEAYADAVEGLAAEREAAGDAVGAVRWWRALARVAPENARLGLRLMRALDAAGNRAGALQYAEVYTRIMREQYEAEPDPAIVEFARQLRTAPVPALPSPSRFEPARTAADPSVRSSPDLEAERSSGDAMQAPPAASAHTDSVPAPSFRRPEPPAQVDGGHQGTAGTRRFAAVCVADMVGWAHRRAYDAPGAERLGDLLQDTIRAEVERYGGHVVEFIGDAALAEFATAENAAVAALRLVAGFQAAADDAGMPATLRVGVHFGEVATSSDGGYYGSAVTGATRLQEDALAGTVLVSADMRARLPRERGWRFFRRGVRAVNGTEPVEVFELREAGNLEVPTRKPVYESGAVERRTGESPKRRHVRVAGRWIAGAAALLGAVVLGLFVRGPTTGPLFPFVPVAPAPTRVAVLYLDNHSANSDLDYLAKGITERLIRELSQVRGLDVVSRNGVKPFRDSPLPIDSVARILRAGSLVGGSLEQSADSLRVSVELVDGETGRVIETASVTRSMAERLSLEDALAAEVARLLRGRLGRELVLRNRSHGARSAEARELLLRAEQAREDAAERLGRSDSLEAASGLRLLAYTDTLLLRAEAVDPRWAQAAALRGWVALDRAAWSSGHDAVRHLRDAMTHAERALKRTPRDPSALEVRGTAAWHLSGTPLPVDTVEHLVDQAVADLNVVVRDDPQAASAWLTLSQLLRLRGDLEGSYHTAQQAFTADAYLLSANLVHERLYRAALIYGRYDIAREHCELGRREFPAQPRFIDCQLTTLARDPDAAPDPDTAWALFRRLEALDSPGKGAVVGRAYGTAFRQMMVASVLARAGQRDSALAVMARARTRVSGSAEMSTNFAYDEACLQVLLGEHDAALNALARYLAALPVYRRFAAKDPALRPIRGNLRFQRLVGPTAERRTPPPPRS